MLERRHLPGGIVALVSQALEADGFMVAFTERTGGESSGRFASLNLGLHVGDAPVMVRHNRERLCGALEIAPFACAEQVHGNRHAWVGPDGAAAGFADRANAISGVDALFTDSRGVPLAMFVADCVPIALVDRPRRAVGVIHAGWRGLASGIVASAVTVFEDPAALAAVVGPAVRIDHYEVGEEVAESVSAATPGGAPTRQDGGRLFIDLPGAALAMLEAAGVRHVEEAQECTACEPDRFFSYRRDGVTGRQALIASVL